MPLFGLTVFVSAFLLFMVQPMAGKVLLPWFGGVPAVWTTCMLFFQLLLLGGYAYSHLLIARLRPRAQVAVHGLLLALAAAALGLCVARWGSPLVPGAGEKPPDSLLPVARLLKLLGASVGLPYLALSTTGPLMQSWFARAHPGRSPYRLYALSNAGSLLALLSYPFVVEPVFGVRAQAWIFAAGLLLFVGLALACARRALHAAPLAAAAPEAAPRPDAPAPTAARWALWICLAACPSIMLLAVTNHLCQEVAVIPFLWVVPLSIYLLTFILCFESDRWYRRGRFLPALAVLLLCGAVLLFRQRLTHVAVHVALFSLLLFATAMVCHGELARLRPAARHLTSFYLALSIGGALGGLFVGLVAPLLFVEYRELDVALLAAWLLAMAALLTDRASFFWGRFRLLARVGFAVFLFVLGFLVAVDVEARDAGILESSRNFWGTLQVELSTDPGAPPRTWLAHGATFHGFQYRQAPLAAEPTAYYTRSAGVGLALENHARRKVGLPLKVGLLGLGVGTLAAYGRPGDTFRFYEVNPDVVRVARDPRYFTYLSGCAATVQMVVGDGRLALEQELSRSEPQGFDVLVVDAFSSDSVPAHLLTRQAFDLYLKHLRDATSLLVFNISNTSLDLAPLLWSSADALGLSCRQVYDVPQMRERDLALPSDWMLLSRRPDALDVPAITSRSKPRPTGVLPAPWTDDFSNLVSVLMPLRP